MHNFRPGRHIGITGASGWLYCEVQNQHNQTIHGYVINGAWEFSMNILTGEAVIFTPRGDDHVTGWKIAFTGVIPKEVTAGKYHSYNDAIAYMEDHPDGKDFGILNSIHFYVLNKWYILVEYKDRFKNGMLGFKQNWNIKANNKYGFIPEKSDGKYLASEVDFEDDDIPF